MHTGITARIARNIRINGVASKATKPYVSFSFDDFPHSAACEGAAALARHSAKATYFVSGARMGRRVEGLDHFTREDLAELSSSGHEIGCHTFSHIRLPKTTPEEIDTEIARNRQFILDFAGPQAPTSFAYPFGALNLRTKRHLARRFDVCRGIESGINGGLIDFGQLKAVLLTEALERSRIAKLLDLTLATNGWTIFFTHDVSREPNEYGCSPRSLAIALAEAAAREMSILPINRAAEEIRTAHACHRRVAAN